MKEKTYVEDVNRSIYDIRNEEKDVYRVKEGLTPEIVDQISKEKHDPDWMREFRQEALKVYNEMTMPDWGPSIEDLNMDEIVTYVRPNTQMSAKWSEVPTDIKNTFEAGRRETHFFQRKFGQTRKTACGTCTAGIRYQLFSSESSSSEDIFKIPASSQPDIVSRSASFRF